MYYPYLRGKQYDLQLIRNEAAILASHHFTPIIEPVKAPSGQLTHAVQAVVTAGSECIVIVNPYHGNCPPGAVAKWMDEHFGETVNLRAGILIRPGITPETIEGMAQQFMHRPIAFVHAGYGNPDALVPITSSLPTSTQVFIDRYCSSTYRSRFKLSPRQVLIRDGLISRTRNADYPPFEEFSDLHLTFQPNFIGFGDFLTAGDSYSDSGGPAYAVAIHMTCLRPTDSVMFIHHFLSIHNDTSANVAGKFMEALQALICEVESPDSFLLETNAMQEFRDLFNQSHYPGLGTVKRISMRHHIETLGSFFQ